MKLVLIYVPRLVSFERFALLNWLASMKSQAAKFNEPDKLNLSFSFEKTLSLLIGIPY